MISFYLKVSSFVLPLIYMFLFKNKFHCITTKILFSTVTAGGYVEGQGGAVPAGQSKVFMVTNLCPNEWPNLSWCSQSRQNGYKNQYGYSEHFDLENGGGQISYLGWANNNPEVTWEFVSCNQGHNEDGRTPNEGMYHQCFCGHNGRK